MVKISQKEFEERIKLRFPDEDFKILEYESTGKPMKIQCCNCNNIIEVSKAGNFLAKNKVNGCKNCKGLWIEREKKLNEIKEKYNIIKTEVKKDTHTYYTIECKKCHHKRTSTLKNLYKHLQCGCETNVYRGRTAEEFLKEVNKNSLNGSYTLVSNYTNQTTKVLLRHSCGFIWEVRPADVIHGRSFCPKCSKSRSKGEILVSKILEELGLSFDMQKTIPNSRLRFDFYFELNNQKIAIEYNGEQHYKEVPIFEASLEEQQERDSRKREYCKNNNIKLIEIPYWLKREEIKQLIISSTTIL